MIVPPAGGVPALTDNSRLTFIVVDGATFRGWPWQRLTLRELPKQMRRSPTHIHRIEHRQRPVEVIEFCNFETPPVYFKTC